MFYVLSRFTSSIGTGKRSLLFAWNTCQPHNKSIIYYPIFPSKLSSYCISYKIFVLHTSSARCTMLASNPALLATEWAKLHVMFPVMRRCRNTNLLSSFDKCSNVYKLKWCILQNITAEYYVNINMKRGGQHLERPNVERPIFRDFEISNIKITKVELFDFSIFESIFYFHDFLSYSNTQNTYMIIYDQIWNF